MNGTTSFLLETQADADPDIQKRARWRPVIWLCLFVCAFLTWTLGRLIQPSAFVFVTLIGATFLGGLWNIASALFGFRSAGKLASAVTLLVGIASVSSPVLFVMQVFSNESAALEVSGPRRYVNPNVAGMAPFRLLNLNVLHGYPDFENQEQRFRDTVNELKRHDADIIILQEAWVTIRHGDMAERLSQELNFNYAYARANGSWNHLGFEEGSAILSRFPIVDAKQIVLKPRRPWYENRIAVVAKLETPSWRFLTVAGVHLSPSSADDQAEDLLEQLAPFAPDIIAGDFNAEPKSKAIKLLSERGDAMEPDNKSDLPWIDHVFLRRDFSRLWNATTAKWIMTSQPIPGVRGAISDHDGILVEFNRK